VVEDNLLDTAYNALLRITTEKDQIPVMRILLTKNKYKEQIIKRLYPMLLTLNKKEEALERINELIEFYNKDAESRAEELKNLKIEKAKIYLQFSNIREAEEIISVESRKNNGSVIWQKLLADLIALKESVYRVPTNPVANPNTTPRSLE
jgi:predicted Zn-dependent protease